MRSRTRSMQAVLVAGLLALPAWGQTNPPQPGTVNYVEGQASVDNQALNSGSVGSVEMQSGQILTTQKGKVEILLTPGVFLRVGENSTLRMDSPGLANTAMTLQHGRALLEVADFHKENDIVMNVDTANVRVTKRGIYDFDVYCGLIRVFNGKVQVQVGGADIGVGQGYEFDLRATGKPRLTASIEIRRRMSFIAGPACAPLIWRTPTWTPRELTGVTDRAGTDPAGIGIAGIAPTPGFPVAATITVRLGGAFTRLASSMQPRSTVSALAVTIVTSDRAHRPFIATRPIARPYYGVRGGGFRGGPISGGVRGGAIRGRAR